MQHSVLAISPWEYDFLVAHMQQKFAWHEEHVVSPVKPEEKRAYALFF